MAVSFSISSPSRPGRSGLVHASILTLLFGLLFLATTVCAAPAPDIDYRSTAATDFASSCTDIAYFGYCRIEANCTTDGSAVTADRSNLQHTFLDLGQCIGYNANAKGLQWREKPVAHWQSGFCAPCSQCNIDAKTTQMTCTCQFTDTAANRATYLTLSDHVSNTGGVLSCLNVAGDPDQHD